MADIDEDEKQNDDRDKDEIDEPNEDSADNDEQLHPDVDSEDRDKDEIDEPNDDAADNDEQLLPDVDSEVRSAGGSLGLKPPKDDMTLDELEENYPEMAKQIQKQELQMKAGPDAEPGIISEDSGVEVGKTKANRKTYSKDTKFQTVGRKISREVLKRKEKTNDKINFQESGPSPQEQVDKVAMKLRKGFEEEANTDYLMVAAPGVGGQPPPAIQPCEDTGVDCPP